MITTIITTYRRPQLLKRAISSVLSQTYSDFQVCVYDNASGDETKEIVQFFRNDPRVKYHCHSENIGMMANYAFGLERVTTPYFSFLSDDDFLLPCFYETALTQLRQFPEAAFAACGVLKVDSEAQIVDNPINLWEREGYYTVPEGMLSMISAKDKFPVPTGVLFQLKHLINIKPDWSNDIQLMWDPDYLLRISSQFPFVITKKTCGVYFVHENAFCNSFFTQAYESSAGLENYLCATNKMRRKLLQDFHIANSTRNEIIKSFKNLVRVPIKGYMRQYIQNKKLNEAYHTAKIFQKYYGNDAQVLFLRFLTDLCKYVPLFNSILSTLIPPFKWIKNFIKSKTKISQMKEDNQEYQKYIEFLCNKNGSLKE